MRISRPTLWVIEGYLVLSAGFWLLLATVPGWDWYQLARSDQVTDGKVIARRILAKTWNEPQRHTIVYHFKAQEGRHWVYNLRQQEVSPVAYDALLPGSPVKVAFWSSNPMRSNLAGNDFMAYQTLSLVCLGFFFVSLWILFRRLAPHRVHQRPAP